MSLATPHAPLLPEFWPCRWDWCRASFPNRSDLLRHIKHHTMTAPPLTMDALRVIERMEATQELSSYEASFLAPSSSQPAHNHATTPASQSQPSTLRLDAHQLGLQEYSSQMSDLEVVSEHEPNVEPIEEQPDSPRAVTNDSLDSEEISAPRGHSFTTLAERAGSATAEPIPRSPPTEDLLRGAARTIQDDSETDHEGPLKRQAAAAPLASQRKSSRLTASRQSSVEPSSSKAVGKAVPGPKARASSTRATSGEPSSRPVNSRKRARSHEIDAPERELRPKRGAAFKKLASIAEQSFPGSQGSMIFEPQATSTQLSQAVPQTQPAASTQGSESDHATTQFLAQHRPTAGSWQPMSQMPMGDYDIGTQDTTLSSQTQGLGNAISSQPETSREDPNADTVSVTEAQGGSRTSSLL
ncbi:hypothetical protein BKA62DRAFT_697207 [Auriculariales sp. MPI-PUGE-AT-0066]|nr:hypothetical protein BKA62DRAFT_697207 [Auriculariales sp. MPI-PUGE-AT-0066]